MAFMYRWPRRHWNDRNDLNGRIDFPEPFRHHLRLGAAEVRGQRRKLAVAVGGFDHIAVHQRQAPHSGAGQLFGRIGADAADAEHQHVRPPQPFQLLIADQQPGPLLPPLEILVFIHDAKTLEKFDP